MTSGKRTVSRKVALLFGSFNPMHEGHLTIARYIIENFPEYEVRFVVSPESPFKQGLGLSGERRLADAKAVVADAGIRAEVSDVEFTLPKPHYTVDTLRYLDGIEPDAEHILVVGGDSIADILTWREGEQLLREFEVWVYPRSGVDCRKICAGLNALEGVKGVRLLDGESVDISSTQLRSSAQYDVIIIGGGVTGIGTARDCAMRGLKTLLVEKTDFAAGASGRNHGLLHSGARYAVSDIESARECAAENAVIKRIAPHCVDPAGGLYLSLPEDDLDYQAKFVEACNMAGIPARRLDPEEALTLEPSANPMLTGAVLVPDCSVDPFKLSIANAIDALRHGAEIIPDCEAIGIIKDKNRVIGLNVKEKGSGDTRQVYSKVVVNAAGIWGVSIARMAGIQIRMFPAKGSLLVFGHRVNNMVLSRCRAASDADILVPGSSVTILGTTSLRVPFDEIDNVEPTPEEVDLLLAEGDKLAPALASTRILRAYAGVRPLVADDNDLSGRSISRGISLFDHATRDGVEGFITITGGKMATYRLMAEKVTDLVCSKIGVRVTCSTAQSILPEPVFRRGKFGGEVICACENITSEEIEYAKNELGCRTLDQLRRRTRLGMGTCQGHPCVKRAASLLDEPEREAFLQERWKGICPVAWGDTLKEAQLIQWIHK